MLISAINVFVEFSVYGGGGTGTKQSNFSQRGEEKGDFWQIDSSLGC